MTSNRETEKSALNTLELTPGDFIRWKTYDSSSLFGIVTDVKKNLVRFKHFEGGFPSELAINPRYSSAEKTTKDESLNHFYNISKDLEKDFGKGGLMGAISARKQHYLDGMISQIKDEEHSLYALCIRPEDPMTGMYVLMGIYSGQGPSNQLEGITINPRLAEETVSKVMRDIRPNGIGGVSNDIYDTPATSHGSLVAYATYEVPKKAVGLVENPIRLDLNLKI